MTHDPDRHLGRRTQSAEAQIKKDQIKKKGGPEEPPFLTALIV
jgi:hypothetical protein